MFGAVEEEAFEAVGEDDEGVGDGSADALLSELVFLLLAVGAPSVASSLPSASPSSSSGFAFFFFFSFFDFFSTPFLPSIESSTAAAAAASGAPGSSRASLAARFDSCSFKLVTVFSSPLASAASSFRRVLSTFRLYDIFASVDGGVPSRSEGAR